MNEITIMLTSDEWLALWRLTDPQVSMSDVAAKIVKDFLAAQQGVQPTFATEPLEDSPWQTGIRRGAVIPSNRNSV